MCYVLFLRINCLQCMRILLKENKKWFADQFVQVNFGKRSSKNMDEWISRMFWSYKYSWNYWMSSVSEKRVYLGTISAHLIIILDIWDHSARKVIQRVTNGRPDTKLWDSQQEKLEWRYWILDRIMKLPDSEVWDKTVKIVFKIAPSEF